jgi:hypothetical protein
VHFALSVGQHRLGVAELVLLEARAARDAKPESAALDEAWAELEPLLP